MTKDSEHLKGFRKEDECIILPIHRGQTVQLASTDDIKKYRLVIRKLWGGSG